MIIIIIIRESLQKEQKEGGGNFKAEREQVTNFTVVTLFRVFAEKP